MSMRYLKMMLILQKCQSMRKNKGWVVILQKQCIGKINADHDEIDVSSDDSNLEGKNHIEHFFSTKFSVQLIYTICIFISKKRFLLFFTSYSASIIDG